MGGRWCGPGLPRSEEPCAPRGSLSRAAWTPVLSPGWLGSGRPLGPAEVLPRVLQPGLGAWTGGCSSLGRLPRGALSLGWAHFGEDGKDPSPRRGGWPPNSASSQRPGGGSSRQQEGLWGQARLGGSLPHLPRGLPPAQRRCPGRVPPRSSSGPSWEPSESCSLRSRPPGTAGPRGPQTHLGVGLEVSKGTGSCWGARL